MFSEDIRLGILLFHDRSYLFPDFMTQLIVLMPTGIGSNIESPGINGERLFQELAKYRLLSTVHDGSHLGVSIVQLWQCLYIPPIDEFSMLVPIEVRCTLGISRFEGPSEPGM